MRERVFIGLGGNVGDRLRFLRGAAGALRRDPEIKLVRRSPVFETSPVGPKQRRFLNAAVELRTSRPPEALLRALKAVERLVGRKKRRRWGPREIDLDILLYGARRVRRRGLTIPHPRWRERKFVLVPLLRLAPRIKDPLTGRSAAWFFRRLTDPAQRIRLYRAANAWTPL